VDARAVLFAYHTRIAAALAPLVLCVFALSLSDRERRVRIVAVLCVWVVYLLWFTWFPVATFRELPPSLLAWLPNILVFAPTLFFGASRYRSAH
jgi:lipopolysaccharide export LptBFGC system permease protein LptF